jgi:hypothetical protein
MPCKFHIHGVFWFRDDLSLVNDKNTLEKHERMMRNGGGDNKKTRMPITNSKIATSNSEGQ